MNQRSLTGHRAFAIATAFAAALSSPAYSQRACSSAAGAKAGDTKAAAFFVERYAAQASLAAVVNGGGIGLLTDPDGQTFFHQVTIGAVLYSNGSAQGQVNFVFPMPFTLKWGALPGVELMHLAGEITGGSVKPNGDVELTGPFIETDYTRGEGIVFQEDSRVSGAAPLKIVVSGVPGSQQFTLAWCSFIPPGGTGSFFVQVTKGTLRIHR
ncbi:MAG: hypothetical protein L0387_20690 [Acidobacteria bacterium]|nr:hypothetical protein [Acidobacteriota bacterium]